VGTLSSIFKPPLPDSLSESVLVVHSWISDNEQLTIRWHKRTKNNWNDKIYGSNSTEGPDDEFRSGRPLMLSGKFKVLFVLVSLVFFWTIITVSLILIS
ncbi:Uncharacterized protein APZ42_006700, partial [Daphnia magna]